MSGKPTGSRLTGRHMFRVPSRVFLICLSMLAGFAQKQVVDGFTINLGVISWEQIQKGITKKPASHVEEYHYKMAREMATMHGGGGKGEYHVLVVIDNRKTGQRVDKADVRVEVIDPAHLQRSVRLQPMTMDGFAGFGEFVHIRFRGTYTFKVLFRLSENEPFKEADFVETIPE